MSSRGPRSRTLATFRELTPAVLRHAASRAAGPLDAGRITDAARRAGAPVAPAEIDVAAARLLAALAGGEQPRPALARALQSRLRGGRAAADSEVESAARWIGATPQQHGDGLRELLRLADSIPTRRPRAPALRFPRIATASA